MPQSRILIDCIKMHRVSDNALSGNFFMTLEMIRALEAEGRVELLVHVDQLTLPYFQDWIPTERLIVEPRIVHSIWDMERCIRKAVRKCRPDLFHKPTGQLPILPVGCRSVWGVADLNYLHLPMGRVKLLYKHLSYRMSARKAAHTIAISDSTREQIISVLKAPPARVTTIYLGTTEIQQPPEPIAGLPLDFVVTFGHHRHKNVKGSFEALARLPSDCPTGLVVIGKVDNLTELKELAERLRIADRVSYVGHVSDGQLRYLYENARCLLFLSHHEGFGLPVLEAMRAECPVISSNAFSLPEVIGDGGRCFDCDDYEGVAEELTRLLRNDEYRIEYIRRGTENRSRFCWQETAKKTIDVYESLLNDKA